MSKSLKEEYRQLMTEDAPDLWGRIEGKVTQKIPADFD